jgi:hypothetical protein
MWRPSLFSLAITVLGSAVLGAAQSTAGLPVRGLTVSGASLASTNYVDVPIFGQKINRLDDTRE